MTLRRMSTSAASMWGDTSGERPTCVVVSHSYLEPAIADVLQASDQYLRIRLLTPSRSPSSVFPDLTSESIRDKVSYEVVSPRRIPLRGALYLLLSSRLGMHRDVAATVVEYDPWIPLFWQVVLARRLFAPGSALFVSVKKNTFRDHPRSFAALKRALARQGFKIVDGVLCTSTATADLYRQALGCPAGLLWVVPHLAVDTARFTPAPRTADAGVCTIGYIGRLSRRKGGDVLLRAAALLHANGVRFVLRMIGPVHDDMVALLRSSDERGYLDVRTEVPNAAIPRLLQGFDIFVMPTSREPDHEEHDGRAVLEAMACGLPCVGSDSGILAEILADGRGRIFSAGDAVALAVELRRLLMRPDDRQDLGRRARAYVERTVEPDVVAVARSGIVHQGIQGRSG